MKDINTHIYFDKFTPHYNPERFTFALDYLKESATDEQSILDIGCGDGGTLQLIKEKTPLKNLSGLDISEKYLRKAKELVGCHIIQGSILDNTSLEEYFGKFDYCVLGSVIHHLIGNNRKESIAKAKSCLKNAFDLLKGGGTLIIFEPTFGPSVVMDIVFWIKKIVSNLTNNRVEISKSWANIGQPVVSYYTLKQLVSFIEGIPNVNIVAKITVDESVLAIFITRVGAGVIVTKIA